jgi:hypothetical protein
VAEVPRCAWWDSSTGLVPGASSSSHLGAVRPSSPLAVDCTVVLVQALVRVYTASRALHAWCALRCTLVPLLITAWVWLACLLDRMQAVVPACTACLAQLAYLHRHRFRTLLDVSPCLLVISTGVDVRSGHAMACMSVGTSRLGALVTVCTTCVW